MPSLSHAHASLWCNDFHFAYVPVPAPIPRALLSQQDAPDSGPVVGFADLREKAADRSTLKLLSCSQLSLEKALFCAFLTCYYV